MRYIGSKATVVDDIFAAVSQAIPSGTFCDPFGGVGVVGAHFKSKGFRVWTGDVLRCAHCFQIARVSLCRMPQFRHLRRELGISGVQDVENILNNLRPRDGWFVREYARKRQFFLVQNAARIQACRCQIADWHRKGWLSHNEHALLLASLIDGLDKVANTAGTYYAYLKKWNRKAIKDFTFQVIQATPGPHGSCFHGDALELARKQFYDVLYLDPPYNDRDYAGYYHLPETIAAGTTPRTKGDSGVPVRRYMQRSAFNSREYAAGALSAIVQASQCRLLVFHYSDDGLIPPALVRQILAKGGPYREILLDTKGYTTKQVSRTTEHRLYMVKRD